MTPYAASLAKYLEPGDRTQAALAESIKRTQASISRWSSTERLPDRETALAIETATEGQVPFALWQAEQARRIGLDPESVAA